MTTPEYLVPDDVSDFNRNGYVLVENLFSEDEVRILLKAVETGARVAENTRGTSDASGKTSRLAIWHELGDDIWTAVSTCPRIVNNIRILLGEEVAFFHGKVMFKDAHEGGAWEWHQDYGYWYSQGFVFPRMISAFIALDECTRENGCLRVLRGSHRLGRLDHVRLGTQTGTDPERIRDIEALFECIDCEMSPGSVLLFHCNLLHSSMPNTSSRHRRSFIICYNALGNPQLGNRKTADQYPCPVGPDDAISRYGPVSG
ncbi:MAG: phytanoyl-CoA dioxygenase family protein [Candidatus Latescibacteria bacterium]|nr:phytanoyl-CoA dioxygenase family protein [Candidatus Latescibacterota bacterium]